MPITTQSRVQCARAQAVCGPTDSTYSPAPARDHRPSGLRCIDERCQPPRGLLPRPPPSVCTPPPVPRQQNAGALPARPSPVKPWSTPGPLCSVWHPFDRPPGRAATPISQAARAARRASTCGARRPLPVQKRPALLFSCWRQVGPRHLPCLSAWALRVPSCAVQGLRRQGPGLRQPHAPLPLWPPACGPLARTLG